MSIAFSKGFDDLKERTKKTSRFIRCCDNCNFFYMTKDDEEEVCQNPDVLPYDVCLDEERTFCSYWRAVGDTRGER